MSVTLRRLVVMRQPSGCQREHVLTGSVDTIRVPFLSNEWTGFGTADFVYSGRHTVDGLPVYESTRNVWHNKHPWEVLIDPTV